MIVVIAIASVLALSGCGSDAQIRFRICGGLEVPEQLDALRISVLDGDLNEQRFALIELTEREVKIEAGRRDGGSSASGGRSAQKDSGAQTAKKTETEEEGTSTAAKTLPLTASLPGNGGSGYVRVQALLKGVEVARFDRRILDLGKTTEVDMPLTDKCYGKYNCPRGQTCVKGDCVVAPIGDDAPGCN
jgi:hypothetical protein